MSENNLKDENSLNNPVNEEVAIAEDLVEKYDSVIENLNSKNLTSAEETKEDNVISTTILSKPEPAKKPSVEVTNDGVISSPGANRKDKAAPKSAKEVEKVALYSTKNVTWSGVGKVYRGYNIVDKNQAEQWLKRDHIRLVTPEEVAKELNG